MVTLLMSVRDPLWPVLRTRPGEWRSERGIVAALGEPFEVGPEVPGGVAELGSVVASSTSRSGS